MQYRRPPKPYPALGGGAGGGGREDGVREAAELASASAGFEVDVETVIDIGLDGRLDCPERRARAERLMGALSAVM